ncbi:MAG: ArsR/SmtB family transcription factor [Salinirussus sp.]
MSQPSVTPTTARTAGQPANDVRTLVAGEDVQKLLDALGDSRCRAILDATSDQAQTASEISETCDLPLSTTYRKLDLLAEVGLLDERVRLRRSGKHASEYIRLAEDVVVSLGSGDETELQVLRRECDERPDPSVSAVGD